MSLKKAEEIVYSISKKWLGDWQDTIQTMEKSGSPL
jgi:hypothetical protein